MIKNKIHILATRPLPEDLLSQTAAQGFHIDVIPMIRIVPIQDEGVAARVAALAKEKATIILTSTNSVHQLTALLPAVPDWSVACLEGNTRKEANAFFGPGRIRYTAPDAANLATVIQKDGTISRVVFFCGDQRLDLLPAALKTAGIELEEIILYATQLQPVTTDKTYDAVLFCSPSAADSFFKQNTLPVDTVLFAIGNTTGQQLRQYTTNKIMISPEHSITALIQQITDYFTHEK